MDAAYRAIREWRELEDEREQNNAIIINGQFTSEYLNLWDEYVAQYQEKKSEFIIALHKAIEEKKGASGYHV